MKKVTLLNVYGKKNIGDEAINQMALKLIDTAFGKSARIFSICVDTQHKDHHEIRRVKITSPYGFVINEGGAKLNQFQKIFRFGEMVSMSLFLTSLGLISKQFLPKAGKYAYISVIRKSDLVLNMGGGYLRTKNPYSDYFGLVTTLLPIFIAKWFSKPMIFLPMSFGNFASKRQESLAFAALSHSTFFARDEITYAKVKNMPGFEQAQINLLYSPDLALLNDYRTKMNPSQKRKNTYVVLSARKWLSAEKQIDYEVSLANLTDYLYEKYDLKTVFIPMAANSVEDNDNQVAQVILDHLQHKKAFSISSAQVPHDVTILLDNAALAICTRMHSAILSSLVCTPFITIQYEHKTLGFMKSLELDSYNCHIEKINFSWLKKNVDILLKNSGDYESIYDKLKSKKKEYKKYEKIIRDEITSVFRV